MSNTLKQIDLREFSLWLLQRRRRFRVTGNSMQPFLNPGDEVLIDPQTYHHNPPHPGDIVVAKHPLKPNLHIIKRVADITENGHYILEGDNPSESSDSRTFGPVAAKNIVGQVTCRFS